MNGKSNDTVFEPCRLQITEICIFNHGYDCKKTKEKKKGVFYLINKTNMTQTKEMFEQWWQCNNTSRPLMNIRVSLDKPTEPLIHETRASTPEQAHIGLEINLPRFLNYARAHLFLCEAVPNFSVNIGPGSLATYVGSEPVFAYDTVWYTKCIEDVSSYPSIAFDSNNIWWKKHFEILKEAKRLSNDEFYVCIPDLVENIDIISAMRGPQEICYDLMDYPDHIKRLIQSVEDIYFEYYDRLYEELKIGESIMYTGFQIIGEGKTAKVQCDFCALIGPEQFNEFVLPLLAKQCGLLRHSMYHLDGPDCIKHMDALMSINDLQAMQWVPSPGQPDCGNELWYPVYDKVKDAGKAMQVNIHNGGYEDWVNAADKFIKRYGCKGVYFLFPEMNSEQANRLIKKAENEWHA
ncbi:MAG: trimethylamine corrinoid protein 2 [Oscillospiraceae bacterium]|nr:trimethylamine corrinoid protein 2 [Oscillospiraceae bacterium]